MKTVQRFTQHATITTPEGKKVKRQKMWGKIVHIKDEDGIHKHFFVWNINDSKFVEVDEENFEKARTDIKYQQRIATIMTSDVVMAEITKL